MPDSIPAIRTVREDDDVHVLEGYAPAFGGPFNGRDSWRTFASRNTDFHLDWFPDDSENPMYIRPVNYDHGMSPAVGDDPGPGMSRVGGWTPIRTDDRGLWIQAQLDKHHKYYDAIRQLLGEEALAFSPESAEHAVRFDDRTGEWLDWPAIAVALTPRPSNPWSSIAVRTAATLRVVERLAEPEAAPAAPSLEVPAVRAGCYDAASAAGILQSLIYLRACELGEADQLAMLDTAIGSVQEFIAAEMAEPDPDVDAPAYMSAVRAGRRNSTSDQQRIDAIHDHVTALGASAHMGDEAQGDDDSGESEAEAARSGGAVPAVLRIVEPADPGKERPDLSRLAAEVGEAAYRSFTA